ncbi:MAG: class I SAM-dependent methyltransferase [Dehalococcoidia bacterium]
MDGPIIGDAFGQMLLDRFAAPDLDASYPELIERDDGLLQTGHRGRYFAPYEEWHAAERALIDGLSGRVLDVGAGAGRVSLYLQDRGCDVVALDISDGAVEVCRRRGLRATFLGTVYDLAATSPAPFDGFVLCGNNMGLLASRDEAPRFLGALAGMARPGARIAGTWLDPYLTDNPDHLAYHQRNRQRGRMGGQLRLRSRHRNLASPWFDYLFCSPAEGEELIARTAWDLAELNRDEQGPGYNVVLRLK